MLLSKKNPGKNPGFHLSLSGLLPSVQCAYVGKLQSAHQYKRATPASVKEKAAKTVSKKHKCPAQTFKKH